MGFFNKWGFHRGIQWDLFGDQMGFLIVIQWDINGIYPLVICFLKWGCPNSWMVYNGKSEKKTDFG